MKNKTPSIKARTEAMLKRLESGCCLEASREYCETIQRAIDGGRVLRPDIAERLYPIALELLDEVEMIELEDREWNARFQLQETRKAIKAKLRGEGQPLAAQNPDEGRTVQAVRPSRFRREF